MLMACLRPIRGQRRRLLLGVLLGHNINENLEYVVIGKFSSGRPDIQDLRRLISKQCELKGECSIGLLSNWHVLIRATRLEDYVNLLSEPTFYFMHQS